MKSEWGSTLLLKTLLRVVHWVVCLKKGSKPTKWINRNQFHEFGCFWVPTEGWKETAPWKKIRFTVKVNIFLKPCICLKSEYWRWGCQWQNFFELLESCISKWENGQRMNWSSKCNPHPFLGHPQEIKNIVTYPQYPKFQKP